MLLSFVCGAYVTMGALLFGLVLESTEPKVAAAIGIHWLVVGAILWPLLVITILGMAMAKWAKRLAKDRKKDEVAT